MIDWMKSIQNRIVTTLSVRVSDFTMVTEMAKPTAAANAMICPGTISLVPGRTMMTTPA